MLIEDMGRLVPANTFNGEEKGPSDDMFYKGTI